jgi:hypothetical protein
LIAADIERQAGQALPVAHQAVGGFDVRGACVGAARAAQAHVQQRVRLFDAAAEDTPAAGAA